MYAKVSVPNEPTEDVGYDLAVFAPLSVTCIVECTRQL